MVVSSQFPPRALPCGHLVRFALLRCVCFVFSPLFNLCVNTTAALLAIQGLETFLLSLIQPLTSDLPLPPGTAAESKDDEETPITYESTL